MDNNFKSQYDECLKEYSRQHQKFLTTALSHGEVVVVITTSRKMARIYTWMLKSGFITLPKDTVVISEYAICFCMDELLNMYGKRLKVLITDDLVNTGKTVESIAQYVIAYTHNKPHFLPFLLSEEACDLSDVKMVGETKKVSKGFCSYATMRNVDNILAMGMPIDMEYPILNIPMPRNWDSSVLLNILQEEFPGCSVYPSIHGISDNDNQRIVTYYTVLLDKEKSKQYSNSDFSKLRFFVGNDSLTIEVYSPKTIDETIFDIPVQFKNDSLQSVWSKITVNKNKDINYSLSDDENLNILSYVVFANYLNSFVTLKEMWQALDKVKSRLGCHLELNIDTRDLNLLISRFRSDDVAAQLNVLFGSDTALASEQSNLMYEFDDSVIPELHRVHYENMNTLSLMSCKSVFEGMCTIFGNQRVFLKKAYPVGESFRSISNLLRIFVKSDDINREIHQCMDYMIDDASVAPSYMRIEKNGRYYWKRLFRAGDNPSLLEAMSEVFAYVFSKYLKTSNRLVVEKETFSTLLSLLFANRMGIPSLPRINGITKLDQHDAYTSIVIHISSDVQILDYMQNNGLLSSKGVNGSVCYEASLFDYGHNQDSFMDCALMNDIDTCLLFIWKYSNHIPTRLRFNMLRPDIQSLEKSTLTTITTLRALLEKYRAKGIEGYKEDLISNMKSLIKLSQGYTICTRNNALPLDEDDSKETKALWQSVFDIDAEDDYITAYVHEVKKLLLLLQLLVTIYEKIVSFNDKEANKSFQELFENSLSENLNLMHFAEFIDSKQVSRKDSEKIIDVCDKLLAEIQDL
ncbi:MAG: hypothetical protein ACI4B4_01080 [Segatella copri]